MESAQLLPYRINFENAASATAPAQTVNVSNQLATSLDWSSFQLTEIAFGDHFITVPAGLQHFTKTEKMTYNNVAFDVQIEAGIRLTTGQVYAKFQSIDPLTGLPPAVEIGFLPPENGTGRGQGHVGYVVKQKASLTTGTEIRNVAEIVFEGQPAIATNKRDPHDASKGIDPTKEALITVWSGSFPSVSTGAATDIDKTTARLNGQVNPNGYATTAQFEYGLTSAYGSTAPVTLTPNNSTTSQSVTAAISGLQPGTTYHYRLKGVTSLETWYGADATLTSAPEPFVLTVHKTGTGTGSIAVDSGSLNWTGNSGTATYSASTPVTLTATADNGSAFTGWNGCDSVVDKQCTLAVNGVRSATATFAVIVACLPEPANLVASWQGEGNANDILGLHQGTSSASVAYASGVVGQAFNMNGVDGFITIPHDPALNPPNISVEAWIKAQPSKTGDAMLVVDKSHGVTDSTGWGVQIHPDGTIGFTYCSGDDGSGPCSLSFTATTAGTTGKTVTDDAWHHVVGTLDNSTVSFYLDGVLQDSHPYSGAPGTNNRDVHIGMSWNGGAPNRFFNGLIDEVKLYNRALGAAEIQANFNAAATGACHASYPLNLGLGWNLLGNSLNTPIDVQKLFGTLTDPVLGITANIDSVWKWDAIVKGWAFYTPKMDAAALQTYTAGRGYAVLGEIKRGEGYWVNTKVPLTLGTQSGQLFILSGAGLVDGWNLVTTGGDMAPTVLNAKLKAGVIPINLTSLWAWDNPAAKWYFYAPLLLDQGGTALVDYITRRDYLDFIATGKTLGNGVGFWISKP